MTKVQAFAIIKEANQMVDQMEKFSTDSKEYADLNEALGWTLDSLVDSKLGWALKLSKRTGHYYLNF